MTGGNRGIGRAVALLFARAGADVAITYRNRAAEADAVVREIQALGRRAIAVGGDLAGHGSGRADVRARSTARSAGSTASWRTPGIWPVEEVPLGKLSESTLA